MTSLRDLRGLGAVLTMIIALDLVLALMCSYLGVFADKIANVPWFEASLLLIKSLQLGVKVCFHMLDVGNSNLSGDDDDFGESYSENGEFYLLLFQTALSAGYLVQLVVYYLYIISVDQFRVSLFDLILIINVKNATVLLLEKIKQVKFYHRLVVDMDNLFPDATSEELDAVADDVCVICLKPMPNQAKKLRCGHLFHRFCLRQCLQKASIGDSFTGLDTLTRVANGMALEPPGGDTASPSTMSMTTLRCPLCRKHVCSGKGDPSSQSVERDADSGGHASPPPNASVEHAIDGVERLGDVQHHAAPAPAAGETPGRQGADQPRAQQGTDDVLRFSSK